MIFPLNLLHYALKVFSAMLVHDADFAIEYKIAWLSGNFTGDIVKGFEHISLTRVCSL